MLPTTPPNVAKYGIYPIEVTCDLLGCCRDVLRKRTSDKKITSQRLNDDAETVAYSAFEILRYWFFATNQTKTEAEINLLLDSIQEKGYEATFGCTPPPAVMRKKRKTKKNPIA